VGDAPSTLMPPQASKVEGTSLASQDELQSDGSGNPRKLSKSASLCDTTLEMTDSGLGDLRRPCHCTLAEPRGQTGLADLGAQLPGQLAPMRFGIATRSPASSQCADGVSGPMTPHLPSAYRA
jgi:hypothetical protein